MRFFKAILNARATIILLASGASLIYGLWAGANRKFPFELIQHIKHPATYSAKRWDSTRQGNYGNEFVSVKTSSSSTTLESDTVAYLSATKAPLIVSLHTWSGNWQQEDPLAQMIKSQGWNYIHPNFQGFNNNPKACLSDLVIRDLDDAIDWALRTGKADPNKIILIGASGGGYTALGYRLKSKHSLRHTFSWVPITSLIDWYEESKIRKNEYADHIIGCVGGEYNRNELAIRSPLYQNERENGGLTLYAGLNDGYIGSVPISHSINYFNKVAKKSEKLENEMIIRLLSRGLSPSGNKLGERSLYLDRSSGSIRFIVFDGEHELLPEVAINEIRSVLESQ